MWLWRHLAGMNHLLLLASLSQKLLHLFLINFFIFIFFIKKAVGFHDVYGKKIVNLNMVEFVIKINCI